jgi:hypothetical protein
MGQKEKRIFKIIQKNFGRSQKGFDYFRFSKNANEEII